MVEFQTHDGGGAFYKTADPCFKKLYVDPSCRTAPEQPGNTEAWDALNKYVPLISNAYTPELDPLEELVSHRSAVLKAQTEGIMHQLYERQKVHDKALTSIDYDVVATDSKLLQLEGWIRGCWTSAPPEFAKRRDTLERTALDLEKQRRDEYGSFWKDRVLLRKELIELASAYSAAKTRESILSGGEQQCSPM